MTIFTLGRRAATLAGGLAAVAIWTYPGGTFRDHATQGYSLTHNFLSDLGMTVAHDGRVNTLGAILFVVSLTTLVVGLGGALVGLIRLYSNEAARRLARGAGVVAVLVCASFIGVAVTPEDRMLSLHILLTRVAFRAFPLVGVLMTLATYYEPRLPRRVGVAWAVLTVILAAYVGILDWGPRVSAPGGLVTQVVAQKIVALSAALIIVYQCLEADRALAIAGPRTA
ncbi:MAG TPA: hypothetical protein VLN49_19315 [Gemmatimonadaceae bacterium]|nr:hypothetical protein [Gemmatimonadaceae bacterium]